MSKDLIVITCVVYFFLLALKYGGRECWASMDENGYKKHGKSNNCKGGIGGGWALDVYKFKE